jgi:hypothetical protein
MGKYFVTVIRNNHKYKLCRDDITQVFSCKVRKIPKVPAYNMIERHK